MSQASPDQPLAQLQTLSTQLPWPLQSSMHAPGGTGISPIDMATAFDVVAIGAGVGKSLPFNVGGARFLRESLLSTAPARSNAPAAVSAFSAALSAD